MPRKLQFRPSQWFNAKELVPVYGIEAKEGSPAIIGKPAELVWSDWMNLAENGKPLFFTTEAERDAKLAELRNQHLPCPSSTTSES